MAKPKRLLALLLAATLAAGLLAGCSNVQAQAPSGTPDGRPSVVATIFPQYDFVRAVAGGLANVTLLLTPGAESHSYEPTPKDILTIQNCDLFIHVGGGSDPWVDRLLESMDTTGMRVMALMDLVPPLEEEIVEGMEHDHGDDHDHDTHDDHEDGHDHDTHEAHTTTVYDEHVWTSPKNAMLIVEALCGALCDADDANTATYQANTDAYVAQLQQLDADLRQLVDGAARRTIIVGDRFPFRYLAAEYGLTYFAAYTGCSTQSGASASAVAFLMDKVEDEHIPVVFHIEMSNCQMSGAICEQTGAKDLQLHSCHNLTRQELESGETYLTLMAKNVENLKEALN